MRTFAFLTVAFQLKMETSAGGKEQVHSRIYWGREIKQTDRWQAMAQEKAALSMGVQSLGSNYITL